MHQKSGDLHSLVCKIFNDKPRNKNEPHSEIAAFGGRVVVATADSLCDTLPTFPRAHGVPRVAERLLPLKLWQRPQCLALPQSPGSFGVARRYQRAT